MPEQAPTEPERAVLDRIQVEELASLTAALVAAGGENPPGGEGPTVEALAAQGSAWELDVSTEEVEPGRPNLSVVLPGGPGPGLLLLGHTDLVPVGHGWTVDPRGGTVRDGRLYGRGSTDMLGGLAACLVAMRALRDVGAALSGPVVLAAVVDEEETGKGIRRYLAAGDRREFLGCVVAEPTDLQTVIAARGASYLEIAVHGRAAHSGSPDTGRNAIYGCTAVVTELEDWHRELAAAAHPLVGPATWSVGLITGGTGASMVPAECLVVADRRLLPDEDAVTVLREVRERVGRLDLVARGLEVTVDMTMDMPGFQTAADHPLVRTADTALAQAGGPGRPLSGWSAACDGGFVARDAGVPVVVLGPGSVAEQAHRPDESVGLDELVVAARTYALTAMRLLGARREG